MLVTLVVASVRTKGIRVDLRDEPKLARQPPAEQLARRAHRAPSSERAVGWTAVALLAIAAAVVLARLWAITNGPAISLTPTSDQAYCELVQTQSLGQLVETARTTPSYVDTILFVMPNRGPEPVTADLAALRAALGSRDFATAATEAQVIDAQTPSVCA